MDEKEIMYTIRYTVQFESGQSEYKIMGVASWNYDQETKMMQIVYDRSSSCYGMHFPIRGKMIKFVAEEEVESSLKYDDSMDWFMRGE